MATTFSVAISYNNALGWIDYDADARKAEVHLADAEGKELTEAYLSCTIGAVIYKEPARFDDMLKKAEQVLEQTKKDGASWAVSS